MKIVNSIALISTVLIGLAGCGGEKKDAPSANSGEVSSVGIPVSEYKVEIYTSENKAGVTFVNPEVVAIEEPIAILKAPEDIGASVYETYHGNRFIIVPKEETEISPYNMLAYGLFLYAQEAGSDWCGPCKMVAPTSYAEAKVFLQEHFKLTGTQSQNAAILEVSNANLERLGEQNLDLDKAIYANIKTMAESLVNLSVNGDFPDLSQLKARSSNEWSVSALTASSEEESVHYLSPFDEKEASEIAYTIREKEANLKSYEQAFSKLQCKDTENREIYMYGLSDNFNAANVENTNPRPGLASVLAPMAQYIHGYDYSSSINNPSIFVETLSGLPTNLTQGIFIVGLKEKGYTLNDTLTNYIDVYKIGADFTQAPNVDGNVSDLRANWNSSSANIYYEELSQLSDSAGQTLLSTLQSGQSSLDAYFMYTTNVDFIAVAACTPKEEDIGIAVADIPTNLDCNTDAGEQYFEILGGIADDFALSIDVASPSTVLQAMPNLIAYDEGMQKVGNFGDTLSHPNSHISQLEILVNTRAGATGAGDDSIYIGQVASLSSSIIAIHDPNDVTAITTLNGGKAHFIYGTDTVYTNGTTASGSLLSLLNSNTNDIDIIVSNQTEVDTVRVSMCIKKDYVEPCLDSDNDGVCDDVDCAPLDPTISEDCDDVVVDPTLPSTCKENFKIDLSQASVWEYNGANPTVNNVFATYPPNPAWANVIWDGDMTWFDFSSASNAEHKLNIDFCACGNTEVFVDELKSDNFSKVYLDGDATPSSYVNTGGYIASRSNGISQSTMASWGPNESGGQTITHSGSGVDHTLHFDVKNGFGPSGGAVDGSLNFRGHMGKCTSADVVSDATDDTYTSDVNLTVVYGGTLAVVNDITFEPVVPGPVGPIDGGTVVIGVKGPVIYTNQTGIPSIESNPKPIEIEVSHTNSVYEEGKSLPENASISLECINEYIKVGWSNQGDYYSHTSSTGCRGNW